MSGLCVPGGSDEPRRVVGCQRCQRRHRARRGELWSQDADAPAVLVQDLGEGGLGLESHLSKKRSFVLFYCRSVEHWTSATFPRSAAGRPTSCQTAA